MTSRTSIPALVFATGVIACTPADESTSAGQESCALADADIEAIRGMKAADDAQVLAGDWVARAESFSPDFVGMPPDHPEIVGREAFLAYAKAFPELVEYESIFEEVDGCGDFAYVKGLYSMAAQPAESKEPSRFTGRWIWILRKNAEGRWLVTRNISNSDQSPATGTDASEGSP